MAMVKFTVYIYNQRQSLEMKEREREREGGRKSAPRRETRLSMSGETTNRIVKKKKKGKRRKGEKEFLWSE